jgi:uncharacterized membrane protein
MESEIGSSLTVVGGVLWLIFALLFIFSALGFVIYAALNDSVELITYGVIFLISGIVLVIFGTFGIKAGKWMKDVEKVKKGGIASLVLGILGLNILAIIGGIIGLVDSKK